MPQVECIVFFQGGIAHVFLDDIRPEEEVWETYKDMMDIKIPVCETWFGGEDDRFKYICRCGCEHSHGNIYKAVTHRLSELDGSQFSGMEPDLRFER